MRPLMLLFVRPADAYRALAARPRWLGALLATLLVAFATNAVIFQTIGLGEVMRSVLGSEPQVEELVRRTEQSLPRQLLLYLAPIPTTAGIVVGAAFALLAAFTLAGATSAGRAVFAVTTHAFFVYEVVTGALTILVVRLRTDLAGLRLDDPLVSSLGDFLDRATTGPFVYSLASSLDVFSLLCLGYLVGGFRVVLAELRPATVWGVVVGLWALYVVGKAAVSLALAA
jgi:hypothetical protein